MMQRLRLAAVSFLNARPITYGIEQGLVGAQRFDLRFAEPSRCAAAVAAGEADLGLMPIAATRPRRPSCASCPASPSPAAARCAP